MQDEDLVQLNNCTDLVSLKKLEAFPLSLLSSRLVGEWVSVRQQCQQVGLDAGDMKPDLFVTWLADPLGNEAYAVILFYDDESKWTLAAHYNKQRLFAAASVNGASQQTSTAPTGSSV
jgi:hypothetical protein